MAIRALLFDTFGTTVDWRGSIIREGRQWSAELGRPVDWAAFADAWRARYQPSMEAVRSGRRPWAPLDQLHRELNERPIDGEQEAVRATSLGPYLQFFERKFLAPLLQTRMRKQKGATALG